jgi:flagellar assembly protein FliH
MSTSPDITVTTGITSVLRGEDARSLPSARLDSPLRGNPLMGALAADPRLCDPRLQAEFDDLAEHIRTEARMEGHALGVAQGLAAAQEQVQRREAERDAERAQQQAQATALLTDALSAVRSAEHALRANVLAAHDEVVREVATVAIDLAEEIVGHEVLLNREHLVSQVQRIVREQAETTSLVVHLNAADFHALSASGAKPEHPGGTLRLAIDVDLKPGDVRVTSPVLQVRALIDEAFGRIRAAVEENMHTRAAMTSMELP